MDVDRRALLRGAVYIMQKKAGKEDAMMVWGVTTLDLLALLDLIDEQEKEIARHHKDFEKWEAIADKGAAQLAVVKAAREAFVAFSCAEISDADADTAWDNLGKALDGLPKD